ncbi:hypothetical protein Tco_0540050 [Tanacetum coccineum]
MIKVQDVGETGFSKVAAIDVIDAGKDVGETDFSEISATYVLDAGKDVPECSKEKVQDVVDVPGKVYEDILSDQRFLFSASDDDNPLSVSDASDSSIYEPKSANKKKKPSKQIASSKASTPKPSSSKPSNLSD